MRPWFHRLLKADLPAGFKDTLPAFLKQEARAFSDAAPPPLSTRERDALTHWYFSPVGQEQLEGLLDATWRQMDSVAQWAMPAHDARHAMFKVPASALLYLQAEDVRDAGRLGIFGALLHDHGRWAEERIFGGPGEGMIHARLSFLLARELVEEFRLPAAAARLILQAVVQHTAGAGVEDPMAVKLTVAADRDQLYGPELVIRLMHHAVTDGSMASVYGEKPGLSVLDRLTHFLLNRIPGPLFSREQHVDRLHSLLATFVLMAEPEAESRVRFAKRPPESASRRALPADFDWASAWQQAHAQVPRADDAPAALRTLLSAPNLVANPAYVDEALDKLSALPADRGPLLAGALAWVHAQRVQLDVEEAARLRQLALVYDSDRPVSALIHRLRKHGYA
jgi:hypothetical protein